jgi:hypothetical protein
LKTSKSKNGEASAYIYKDCIIYDENNISCEYKKDDNINYEDVRLTISNNTRKSSMVTIYPSLLVVIGWEILSSQYGKNYLYGMELFISLLN